MSEYQFLGESNAVAYDAFGYTVMRKYVDFADLVANPQKLALASAPNTPLSSFAGFVAADILNVFHVPAGFVALNAGWYNIAIDTVQPTAKLQLGDGASVAGFAAANLLTAGTAVQTLLTDAYGSSNMESRIYLVNDTIDAIGSVQTIVDAKVMFYVIGCKAFDITAAAAL